MEPQSPSQPQPNVAPQVHPKPYLIVIVSLVTLILGGTGGYFLGVTLSPKQTTPVATLPSQTPSNSQSTNQLSNIIYLMKYSNGDPNTDKTIFLTKDNSGEALKLSDTNMTETNTKILHKFDSPSVVNFNPPFSIVGNYIVAPVVGADANDILIFSLNGDVITTSVRQGNKELTNWLVSYDEWVKDSIIKIKLFQIDNSTGTAQIDLTTGKMVPGSLKI